MLAQLKINMQKGRMSTEGKQSKHREVFEI